jgi:hypothetical protein
MSQETLWWMVAPAASVEARPATLLEKSTTCALRPKNLQRGSAHLQPPANCSQAPPPPPPPPHPPPIPQEPRAFRQPRAAAGPSPAAASLSSGARCGAPPPTHPPTHPPTQTHLKSAAASVVPIHLRPPCTCPPSCSAPCGSNPARQAHSSQACRLGTSGTLPHPPNRACLKVGLRRSR